MYNIKDSLKPYKKYWVFEYSIKTGVLRKDHGKLTGDKLLELLYRARYNPTTDTFINKSRDTEYSVTELRG